MQPEFQAEGWKIIEAGFRPEQQLWAESVFSLCNGAMGHRASFEEQYSGETAPANYIAGIFFQELYAVPPIPGYPPARTQLAVAPAWIDLDLEFDGETFDLARCEVLDFQRVLNMREGFLERTFTVRLPSGRRVRVQTQRFCSAAEQELGALRYLVQPLDFSGTLALTTGIDANVHEIEPNDRQPYWVEVEARERRTQAYLLTEIKHTDFQVCSGMKLAIFQNGTPVDYHSFRIQRDRYVGLSVDLPCKKGDQIEIFKYAAHASSRQDGDPDSLFERCQRILKDASRKGFASLLEQHAQVWANRWANADIQIEGDPEAQAAMRFNLFHLLQAYTGHDERLNIGLRGLTGDTSGGAAYWFSDLFLPPFFAATGNEQAARNLLVNRYRQLPKAKAIAEKMGIGQGAALFPMATLDGEETLERWELTFEAIHRNAAVAYAIYRFVEFTGDREFLRVFGGEILTAIARFWVQRVQFSPTRKQYVLLGVTGPNDYENNVNNNWYTNYMAAWCLQYAAKVADEVEAAATAAPDVFFTDLPDAEERSRWRELSRNIYLPEQNGLFLQQDGFQEKEILPRAALDPEDLPLEMHWTWDRILRSAFLKHADVLLAFFLFDDAFDEETQRRHFEYYEPLTVYDSAYGYGVHAQLAAQLRKRDLAHELFRKALTVDLNNLRGDTRAGCHVPAMGLTWWALVHGIAGCRPEEGVLTVNPLLPFAWKALRFALSYRNCRLHVHLSKTQCHLINLSDHAAEVRVGKKTYTLPAWGEVIAVYGEKQD